MLSIEFVLNPEYSLKLLLYLIWYEYIYFLEIKTNALWKHRTLSSDSNEIWPVSYRSKCMNFTRFSEQRVEGASTTAAITARPAPSFRVSVTLITVCSHLCGLDESPAGSQPTQADSGTVCTPNSMNIELPIKHVLTNILNCQPTLADKHIPYTLTSRILYATLF